MGAGGLQFVRDYAIIFNVSLSPCATVHRQCKNRAGVKNLEKHVSAEYLQHDYYTDIITFDYCEGDRLSGDLFISLDTIRTNAEQFGASYEDELHRVIIHGILHLCGINDKGPGEREVMEAAENQALTMRQA